MNEQQMKDRIEYVKSERDNAGERALRVVERLRDDLSRMESAIKAGMADQPASASDFTPGSQNLAEVTEWGAKFESLWTANGILSR